MPKRQAKKKKHEWVVKLKLEKGEFQLGEK